MWGNCKKFQKRGTRMWSGQVVCVVVEDGPEPRLGGSHHVSVAPEQQTKMRLLWRCDSIDQQEMDKFSRR